MSILVQQAAASSILPQIGLQMAKRETLGGIIHTYQRYDPKRFPSPSQPPPDMVSPAFEHMLAFGELRELSEEELRGP